jgi:hypothetical protein
MTLYNFLIENKAVIKVLAKNGLIPSHAAAHQSLYEDVKKAQEKGMAATDSYWEVAEKRKVGINTVIKAVVTMRAEI